MGLFPMCLSKIYSTHTFGERKEREKRKRREREREERKEEEGKEGELGDSPKSKPKEAIESSTKLKEVRKPIFYICIY